MAQGRHLLHSWLLLCRQALVRWGLKSLPRSWEAAFRRLLRLHTVTLHHSLPEPQGMMWCHSETAKIQPQLGDAIDNCSPSWLTYKLQTSGAMTLSACCNMSMSHIYSGNRVALWAQQTHMQNRFWLTQLLPYLLQTMMHRDHSKKS